MEYLYNLLGLVLGGFGGAIGMWLYWSFRDTPAHYVDADDAKTIRLLDETADYYRRRADYYERFAKSLGLTRSHRFPSFEAWRRKNGKRKRR